MINKNELRFGNKVQPDKEHAAQFNNIRILSVTQIYEGGFTVDYHWPGKWFEGIPLSTEILLACGFTPLSDPEFTHHHPELNILFDGESFWLKEGSITHYLGKCEYLHKLQNGVFWVTGKELIVNIEKVKV